MAVLTTRTVLWLGAPPCGTLGASGDACKDYPTVLDKGTIQEYAEKCGKQKAKEWIMKETGVDVGSCLDGNLKQSPECIANNYGIKLGVIKDGEVQWDVVVNDAGAIGGIAVCAATGAGAALASFCGKTGAMLANIAYGIIEPLVGEFVKLFWGDNEKITYCNLNAPVDLVKVQLPGYNAGSSRALAQWMASPYAATLPGALGPVLFPGGVAGTKSYWSKILIMRGLAQASAIVLRGFSEQTGLAPAQALDVLKLQAPPGWVELIRPQYAGKAHDDLKLNTAALLDGLMMPEVIRKLRGEDVIVPSYALPAFWTGVPVAPSVTNFFELQNVNQGCVTSVMWGSRDPKIAKPTGPAYQRTKMQVYWEYTTPAIINAFALADNATFLKMTNAWKASLHQNFTAKIAQGRALATPKAKSALPLVLAVGGAAALAWWLWPARGLLKANPTTLIQTRGVLAGAYKGKRQNLKDALSHAVEVDETGRELRVLCGRVEFDNLADEYAGGLDEPVTCKTCAKRDPRNKP